MLNFLHYNVNVNIITCQICAFYDYYVQGLQLLLLLCTGVTVLQLKQYK